MRRFSMLLVAMLGFMVLMGADGCSSDPNVEGAKLDLRNKDYDRALENLNTALESNPDNAEALALKGTVLREKLNESPVGDMQAHAAMVQEMVESYRKASALGQDVSRDMAFAYQEEFQRGVQAFNRGNEKDDEAEFRMAADLFASTATIAPDSVGPAINRAYALVRTSQSTDAIPAFEQAMALGDNDPQTYIFLSDLYHQVDRGSDAVAILEKAESMHQGNVDLQAYLLNAYQRNGLMDRAMDKYSENVQAEPNNKLYRYNYGSLLLEAERYDEAIEQLEAAVELDPTYANAHYNLGASYQNQAVGYNDRISGMDDELRANRSSMSPAAIAKVETEMDELAEMRRESFANAIVPLQQAKRLTEEQGGDTVGICVALYTAYVQTNQLDKAEMVSACAGYDEAN